MEPPPKIAENTDIKEVQNNKSPISANTEAPKFRDISAEDTNIKNAIPAEVKKV